MTRNELLDAVRGWIAVNREPVSRGASPDTAQVAGWLSELRAAVAPDERAAVDGACDRLRAGVPSVSALDGLRACLDMVARSPEPSPAPFPTPAPVPVVEAPAAAGSFRPAVAGENTTDPSDTGTFGLTHEQVAQNEADEACGLIPAALAEAEEAVAAQAVALKSVRADAAGMAQTNARLTLELTGARAQVAALTEAAEEAAHAAAAKSSDDCHCTDLDCINILAGLRRLTASARASVAAADHQPLA